MVRKMGGFTFQELDLTIDDIKSASESWPDLSYARRRGPSSWWGSAVSSCGGGFGALDCDGEHTGRFLAGGR
jgi:hypothetical protein